MLILSILVFIATVVAAAELVFGMSRMRSLSSFPSLSKGMLPCVSVILPVCNEQEGIERAVLSQLGQDYRDLEIIIINDRSTDATGEILERLAKMHQRLRVRHISELPAGWMGKAHAMQQGAAMATGEILLFTDGDSEMDPSTVSRAAGYMTECGLDHLTLFFRNSTSGYLLNCLILEVEMGLMWLLRPWRARRSRRAFIGVGAFNMVKKEAYLAIGGHERFRMHPLDDLMLGKILKRYGAQQECVLGFDMVSVPWYDSLLEMVDGLMKNSLALINYRFSLLPLAVSLIVVGSILPLWLAVLASGPERGFALATVVCNLFLGAAGARVMGLSLCHAPGTLLAPYITVCILLRAGWRNYRDGGIVWRGTFYPLAQLRENEPVLFSLRENR